MRVSLLTSSIIYNVKFSNTGHLDDGDGAVFLVHPVDVGAEVQCLLIVAVADTRLHYLRDFKNLEQLRVP